MRLRGEALPFEPSTLSPERELEGPMRANSLLTLMIVLTLPVATVAQSPPDAASRLVVMPAGDLKWADLDPGIPGSKVVELWGDRANGAFGALFQLPAGFAAPLHTHNHDMKVVILSGTY